MKLAHIVKEAKKDVDIHREYEPGEVLNLPEKRIEYSSFYTHTMQHKVLRSGQV